MLIKKVFGINSKKHKNCLRCEHIFQKDLNDDVIYICEHCGQQHFVDIYSDNIALTVIERPDIRKRHLEHISPKQRQARKALIDKVETRQQDAWVATHKQWLEELVALPEDLFAEEFNFMDEEMQKRVMQYLEKQQ